MPVTAPLIRRLAPAALALVAATGCRAQTAEPLPTARLAADTYLITAPTGNLVVGTGPDAAILVGVQSPALTPRLRATIASLTPAHVRFVVAASGPGAAAAGAAGWENAGAMVVMHEALAGAGHRFHAPLPHVGFSEVTQLLANSDYVHVVHQPTGYSPADVSAHFERAGVLYLGYTFTTDGYPPLDSAGTLAGMIETADKFVNFPPLLKVVPGRGPVSDVAGLRAYRDMLAGVRDALAPMVRSGRTLAEAQAARPTAPWDARWGRGPVTPAAFVAAAWRSLGGR